MGLTAAVVLAAGAGSRFTGPGHKLLALVDGAPVVRRAVDAAVAAAIGPVVVVVAPGDDGDRIAAALDRDTIRLVRNEHAAAGIATSLQAGVAAARELAAGAVVVGLGDQPFVGPAAWRAVAACDATPVATATFDGARTPPVRIAAAVWAALPVDGDQGASALLRARPDLVTEVPCDGSAADVDTVEDLARWS